MYPVHGIYQVPGRKWTQVPYVYRPGIYEYIYTIYLYIVIYRYRT